MQLVDHWTITFPKSLNDFDPKVMSLGYVDESI